MLVRDDSSAVIVQAPAKLNLFLQVLGKRPDGFHELETLMVAIDHYDTLRFAPRATGEISLTCHDARHRQRPAAEGESLPVQGGPENLAYRAALLLRTAVGRESLGAHIDLEKRIPLAAGLAGGSTDAAATLAGLNRLWKLGLSAAELQDLASRLGSDVPFFLAPSGAAICRGRGERIEPVRWSAPLHCVVVRPRSGLSTARVFQHCRPGAAPHGVGQLVGSLKRGNVGQAARSLHNSLQPAAEHLNAEVTQLREAFSRLPFLGHLMSGSGTSYFGICRHRGEALRLASRLRAQRLGDAFVASSRT